MEALTSSVAGFLLAWAIQIYVVPLIINAPVPAKQGFVVVVIFTVVSIVRSYVFRRIFNGLHQR